MQDKADNRDVGDRRAYLAERISTGGSSVAEVARRLSEDNICGCLTLSSLVSPLMTLCSGGVRMGGAWGCNVINILGRGGTRDVAATNHVTLQQQKCGNGREREKKFMRQPLKNV